MNKSSKTYGETCILLPWVKKVRVKMSILPKFPYRFNTIAVKIPARYFCRHRKYYFKMCMKTKQNKGITVGKAILKKKNNGGRVIVPDFKTYYKAIKIKTVIWWKDRPRSMEWNTEPRKRPTEIHTPDFPTKVRTQFSGGRGLFNSRCQSN